MDIQRKEFEEWAKANGYHVAKKPIGEVYLSLNCNNAWKAWQAAKAQAVLNTQALHDRLLVESIKDHVDSHLAESESAIDYFDKGWFAAMRCVRHNIAMIEAQEQNQ